MVAGLNGNLSQKKHLHDFTIISRPVSANRTGRIISDIVSRERLSCGIDVYERLTISTARLPATL